MYTTFKFEEKVLFLDRNYGKGTLDPLLHC